MIRIIIILFLASGLFSCGKLGLYNQDKGIVIASAGNKKLYNNDIQHLVSGDMSKEDSTYLVDTYIENWVKNELKIAAAETALSDDEETIEELVSQYRRSLLTYKYEESFVNKKLDTTITNPQIEEYYTDNRDNFRLAGPIVKAFVARLPKELRTVKKFESLIKSSSDSARMEFKAICQKNNYRYADFSQEWTDFSTVITNLPFSNSNFDEFLKTKKYYETEDGEYKYVMNIISYRPTGDYSPIELQTNNIKKILLNSRRAELIRNLEDSLVKKAIEDKTVQIGEK